MIRAIARFVVPLGMALFLALPARAQLTVFDPSNFVENVTQAADALQQIQNQVQGLTNQAQMLLNQSKNLTSLSYSSLGTIGTDISQVSSLLQQANGIAYNVQSIDQAFASQYPTSITAGTSDAQLIASAQQRWANSVASFHDSMDVQAGVVQTIPSTATETMNVASASQSAVGVLQAVQAGNQLMAILSKQLADLTALLAAQSRAQALAASQQAESQEQAQEQLSRFLNRAVGYQPQPVQMFH